MNERQINAAIAKAKARKLKIQNYFLENGWKLENRSFDCFIKNGMEVLCGAGFLLHIIQKDGSLGDGMTLEYFISEFA